MQSIYFIIAMASDWLVGHEGTLLGAQSDGLGLRYPHHCRGWRFHLARVDKQSERLLPRREEEKIVREVKVRLNAGTRRAKPQVRLQPAAVGVAIAAVP